jgi:hypothetical protein
MTNLIKALEYEELLIGNLVAIGREKTDLLKRNKPMDLPAVTSKEEAVVEQMNQLEKVRQQLNAKAAEQLGVTEPNPPSPPCVPSLNRRRPSGSAPCATNCARPWKHCGNRMPSTPSCCSNHSTM